MTKIKMCGLSRPCDIEAANEIRPDYIGFVFVKTRRRYVPPETAAELKKMLSPEIQAVGVFIDEEPETVAKLLNRGIIDMAQLHGSEDEDYIRRLRLLTGKPLIQAFRIQTEEDRIRAARSSADYVLLDSGAGTGETFDWSLLEKQMEGAGAAQPGDAGRTGIHRPYFLAGGLSLANIGEAIRTLHPYAVDVSSGIETDGLKDRNKMAAFAAAVRKEDEI